MTDNDVEVRILLTGGGWRVTRWVASGVIVFGLLWLCWGCTPLGYTSVMGREPRRKVVTVQESTDAAYVRAVRAMARMGGQVTQADSQGRLLSAIVHKAVVLNVLVQPGVEGTHIEVEGSLLPGKIVVGSFDEVDTYVAYLQ